MDIFTLVYPFSPLTARYRLKYSLKGPLNPKQPTNQSAIPGVDGCVVAGKKPLV